MYRRCFKRIIDIIISFFLIILLLPIMIIITILIRIKLGRPIIFKQERPGKDERIFTIYKFRTMTNEHSKNGELLSDNIRFTNFGRFLRNTSLDELPELWNIFTGDMSLVGPRPLLIQYLPIYTEQQKRRHLVRPGLTGWAQVNGRNAISWEEKFKYDIEYIDILSFWIDIKIFWMSIFKVLKHEGITQYGEATMQIFKGNHH